MADTYTYTDDEIVGTFKAAKVLGVSHDTVRRLADSGEIPSQMSGPGPAAHRRFVVGELRAAQRRWNAARKGDDEPAP